MEQTRFDYSMKNIPIPSRNTYIKKLIEKTESVIKRIRWKAFFFEQNKDKNKTNRDSDNDDSNSAIDNNFGFKSRKCPPQNEELNNFEADVYDMIKNIEFRQETTSKTNYNMTSGKSTNLRKHLHLPTKQTTTTK